MILKNNKRIDGCSDTVPIGTLNPFLGSAAPYGYLLCQGQKVSKTTYKELYEICGDTFGQSTDTEFYLPDLRGQTIAGYKEGDLTFGTLGGLIGSLTHLHSTGNHTLTIDEIPSHSHLMSKEEGIFWSPTNGGIWGLDSGKGVQRNNFNTQATGQGQAHNHGDTSLNSSLQPTIVLNWIVKAFQLMPNQSYVSSVMQDSDVNTYSCNYINDIIPDTQNLGKIVVDDIECKNLASSNRIGWKQKMTYATFNSNILKYQAMASNWSGFNFILSEDLIVGEIYTVSFKNTSNLGMHVNITRTNTGWQGDWDNSYITSQYVSANSRFSYTFTATTSLAGIFFIASTNSDADTEERIITEIQIEKGQIVTSWSPHKEFSNKQIYSTEEQVIGTWLGKPLYRKILPEYTINNSTEFQDITALTDIKQIINIKGFCVHSSGNTYTIPFAEFNPVSKETYTLSVIYDVTKKSIQVRHNGFPNSKLYIIIEYTKTTD